MTSVSEPEHPWPRFRDVPFAAEHAPALAAAWTFSAQQLENLHASLRQLPAIPELAAVAVSGSLCRMEADENSDVDLLVLIESQHDEVPAERAEQIYQTVWTVLEEGSSAANVREPKPDGIFSRAVLLGPLTDKSQRGQLNEALTMFGHRMQLLIDAQPVLHFERFFEIRQQILSWYAETEVALEFGESSRWHWLWQDVHRYWRSLRSRATWLCRDQRHRLIEINLKLRSSRLMLVWSFLQLLALRANGQTSLHEDLEDISRQLLFTPLERAMTASESESHQILQLYEFLWQRTRGAASGEITYVTDGDRAAMKQLVDLLTLQSADPKADWML